MISMKLEALKEQQVLLTRDIERLGFKNNKDASPELAALMLISSLLVVLIEAVEESKTQCPVK